MVNVSLSRNLLDSIVYCADFIAGVVGFAVLFAGAGHDYFVVVKPVIL